MRIRSFVEEDLTAIHAIQLKCPHAAQWRPEDYLQLAHDSSATVLVAEIGTENAPAIAGFAVFHRVMDEAELRNIAVDSRQQRKGIARALLETGIRTVHESGAQRLFLEVRASNQSALALYASAGFQLLNRRRDYYRDPLEDALVMVRDLSAILTAPSS